MESSYQNRPKAYYFLLFTTEWSHVNFVLAGCATNTER